MPVYMVRWTNPEPSICLVAANSKRDALIMMDEIADPSYCRVEEYQGPLWLSIDLLLQSHQEETEVGEGITELHTVVDDVGECSDGIALEIFTEAETGMEMKDEIIRVAFPNYSAYLKNRFDSGREEVTPADEAECKAAIQRDFDMEEQRVQYVLSHPEEDGDEEKTEA